MMTDYKDYHFSSGTSIPSHRTELLLFENLDVDPVLCIWYMFFSFELHLNLLR